jgi:hypothetical protein
MVLPIPAAPRKISPADEERMLLLAAVKPDIRLIDLELSSQVQLYALMDLIWGSPTRAAGSEALRSTFSHASSLVFLSTRVTRHAPPGLAEDRVGLEMAGFAAVARADRPLFDRVRYAELAALLDFAPSAPSLALAAQPPPSRSGLAAVEEAGADPPADARAASRGRSLARQPRGGLLGRPATIEQACDLQPLVPRSTRAAFGRCACASPCISSVAADGEYPPPAARLRRSSLLTVEGERPISSATRAARSPLASAANIISRSRVLR